MKVINIVIINDDFIVFYKEEFGIVICLMFKKRNDILEIFDYYF